MLIDDFINGRLVTYENIIHIFILRPACSVSVWCKVDHRQLSFAQRLLLSCLISLLNNYVMFYGCQSNYYKGFYDSLEPMFVYHAWLSTLEYHPVWMSSFILPSVYYTRVTQCLKAARQAGLYIIPGTTRSVLVTAQWFIGVIVSNRFGSDSNKENRSICNEDPASEHLWL